MCSQITSHLVYQHLISGQGIYLFLYATHHIQQTADCYLATTFCDEDKDFLVAPCALISISLPASPATTNCSASLADL